ncbi:MAG: hypothetical protein AAGA09_00520 [Pseudomonadota bacterium]
MGLFFVAAILLALAALAIVIWPARAVFTRRAQQGDASPKDPVSRIGAVLLLGILPLGAGALYLALGAPESLDPNFSPPAAPSSPQDAAAAMAALPEEERAAMIENMVAGLEARLEETPDDINGWRMLARSYGVLRRPKDAARAYRSLLARDENASAEDWRNFAAALVADRGDDETVAGISDEAVDALERLRSFNADDPLALFYLGIAARERGDIDGAAALWRRLQEIAPADGPLAPVLERLLGEIDAG